MRTEWKVEARYISIASVKGTRSNLIKGEHFGENGFNSEIVIYYTKKHGNLFERIRVKLVFPEIHVAF